MIDNDKHNRDSTDTKQIQNRYKTDTTIETLQTNPNNKQILFLYGKNMALVWQEGSDHTSDASPDWC